jgi:hypothetical protein
MINMDGVPISQYDRDLANPPEIEREQPGHWLVRVTVKRQYIFALDGLKAEVEKEAVALAMERPFEYEKNDDSDYKVESYEY